MKGSTTIHTRATAGEAAALPCKVFEPTNPLDRRMGESIAGVGPWLVIGSPTAGDDAGDFGEVQCIEFKQYSGSSRFNASSDHSFGAEQPCGEIVQTALFRSSSGFNHFGCAVAVARIRTGRGPSPLVLIGADNADIDGVPAGHVEVHFRASDSAPSPTSSAAQKRTAGRDTNVADTDSPWLFEGLLVSHAPQAGAEFGAALAISGGDPTVVAVGAPRTDVGEHFDSGAVELFRRVTTPHSPPVTPTAPVVDRTTDERVDLERTVEARTQRAQRGRTQQRSTTSWRSTVVLTCPIPQMSGWFGRAIALNNRWLAIGAPGTDLEDTTSTEPALSSIGAVFLYRMTSGHPTLVATIFPPDRQTSMWFGSALSLDGDRLVVGAPGAASLSAEFASVPRMDITHSEAAADRAASEFIDAVAGDITGNATGNVAGEGAGDGTGDAIRPGAVYFYDLRAALLEPTRIDAPIVEAGAGFGQTVALAQGTLIVGAPGVDGEAIDAKGRRSRIEDAGRAFCYRVPWAAWNGGFSTPSEIRGPSQLPSAYFGHACALLAFGEASHAGETLQPFAATGHLYVEEESHAPSPGVSLHRIP